MHLSQIELMQRREERVTASIRDGNQEDATTHLVFFKLLPLKRSVTGLMVLGAMGAEMVAVVVMVLKVEVRSGDGEAEGED